MHFTSHIFLVIYYIYVYTASLISVIICGPGPSTFAYLLTLAMNLLFYTEEEGVRNVVVTRCVRNVVVTPCVRNVVVIHCVRNVVVTHCGLDGPGLNPGRGEVFQTQPNRPETHPLPHMKGTGFLCRG